MSRAFAALAVVMAVSAAGYTWLTTQQPELGSALLCVLAATFCLGCTVIAGTAAVHHSTTTKD